MTCFTKFSLNVHYHVEVNYFLAVLLLLENLHGYAVFKCVSACVSACASDDDDCTHTP